jgi:hypothetical protein
MGWTDSHLHRFIINGEEYGVAQIGGISFTSNPHKVQLADFRLGNYRSFFVIHFKLLFIRPNL